MNGKVIFNGKKTEMTLTKIKEKIISYGSFSGSINAGNTMFLFNNLNFKEFDYFVNIFNTQKNKQPKTEVTFDIRTNVIETISL